MEILLYDGGILTPTYITTTEQGFIPIKDEQGQNMKYKSIKAYFSPILRHMGTSMKKIESETILFCTESEMIDRVMKKYKYPIHKSYIFYMPSVFNCIQRLDDFSNKKYKWGYFSIINDGPSYHLFNEKNEPIK